MVALGGDLRFLKKGERGDVRADTDTRFHIQKQEDTSNGSYSARVSHNPLVACLEPIRSSGST